MCEILVRATNQARFDPPYRDSLSEKRGQPIACEEDGFAWTQGLPDHVLVKLPEYPKASALKYVEPWMADNDVTRPYLLRKWRIEVDSLPAAALAKFKAVGFIVVKVGAYAGAYDYTWDQVRAFFRNCRTGDTE